MPFVTNVRAVDADQMLLVHCAPVMLERVVGTHERLQVVGSRVVTASIPREGVQLVVRRDLLAREFDSHITKRPRAVVVLATTKVAEGTAMAGCRIKGTGVHD